eukprot:sb/3469510/
MSLNNTTYGLDEEMTTAPNIQELAEEATLLAPTPATPAPPGVYFTPELSFAGPPREPTPVRDNTTQSFPSDGENCARTAAVRDLVESLEEMFYQLSQEDSIPLRSKTLYIEKTHRKLAIRQVDVFLTLSPGSKQAAKTLLWESTEPIRMALIQSSPLPLILAGINRTIGTLYKFAYDRGFPHKEQEAGPSRPVPQENPIPRRPRHTRPRSTGRKAQGKGKYPAPKPRK